jgi:hypothetical protein
MCGVCVGAGQYCSTTVAGMPYIPCLLLYYFNDLIKTIERFEPESELGAKPWSVMAG